MMSPFERDVRECMRDDLRSYEMLSPLEKVRAYCQWKLGDPEWADTIISAMEEFGYSVKETPND